MADVRTITTAEVAPWVDALRTGFHEAPAPDSTEAEFRGRSLDLDHSWAAFDGDRIVGTLRSFDTPLAVPGEVEVPATALTHVSVSASHRRQGLLTRMITADLDACAARGDAVSVLVAAEYPIYGRYGYGPAAEAASLEIDTSTPFLDAPTGRVELVDRDDFRRLAPAIYDRVRPEVPGAIAREDWWWDITLGHVAIAGRTAPTFFVIGYDGSGTADGFAAYRIEDDWQGGRPRCRLQADDLVGVDSDATTRLWRHCMEHDWVAKVLADNRSVAEPLRWHLHDARAIQQVERFDLLWLRLLDPCAALAGRRYLTSGRVVLEIDDPIGYTAGRFVLRGDPSGATCEVTDEPADLAVSVQAISSAYLGGYSLAELAGSGLVTELTSGALATADPMFRAPGLPWCVTHF